MGFHLSKARLPGQFQFLNLSTLRGALQIGGQTARRFTADSRGALHIPRSEGQFCTPKHSHNTNWSSPGVALEMKIRSRSTGPAPLIYSTALSMNPSVLAFSTNVRTFARSSPDGTSASISSFSFTELPGIVVSCSTIASTI